MDNYINKIYMKGIYFILLLCLATIPSIGLVLDRDSLTQLTVWWFTFGIAIAIVEFCMFMNQEYMSSKNVPMIIQLGTQKTTQQICLVLRFGQMVERVL